MMRGITVSLFVLAATLEPVIGDGDLLKYAITQGGLAIVVIVLLWSYRRDTMSVLKEQEERLHVMAGLVSASATALTRSADASERMARAVENMDRRR